MNEEQWLAANEPRPLLEALPPTGRASDRKLRLFACACCRRVWDLMPPDDYPEWRTAVEKAEEHADGLLTPEQMWDHAILSRLKDEMEWGRCWLYNAGAAAQAASNWSDAEGRWCHWRERCVGFSPAMAVAAAAQAAEAAAYHAALSDWIGQQVLYDERPADPAWLAALAAEQQAQAALAREVLDNPFCPLTPLPGSSLGWREGIVVRLAQAAYDNRLLPSSHLDPARLAVLADALEEAGCASPAVLGHLRSPGPHARGCWAVDLARSVD
jgi:hypothetical protein